MKTTIIKPILVSTIGLVLFLGVAFAQETGLPSPGITPTSSFYFVEQALEGVRTLFTFGNYAKSERYLMLSEKRLAESEELAEKGDERVQESIIRYEKQFAAAKNRAARAGDIDLELRVAGATTKHLSVFDNIIERISDEQTKNTILLAKERAIQGQVESLRKFVRKDVMHTVDVFARAAEGRLRRAETRANGRGDDNKKNEQIERTLEEYNEYVEFEKEISSLARGLRTGENTVEELVERATSHHLDVLRNIQHKVPAKAQQSIQQTIDAKEAWEQRKLAIPELKPPQD